MRLLSVSGVLLAVAFIGWKQHVSQRHRHQTTPSPRGAPSYSSTPQVIRISGVSFAKRHGATRTVHYARQS